MLSSDIAWSLNLPGPGISVMSTEGTLAYGGIVCWNALVLAALCLDEVYLLNLCPKTRF